MLVNLVTAGIAGVKWHRKEPCARQIFGVTFRLFLPMIDHVTSELVRKRSFEVCKTVILAQLCDMLQLFDSVVVQLGIGTLIDLSHRAIHRACSRVVMKAPCTLRERKIFTLGR